MKIDDFFTTTPFLIQRFLRLYRLERAWNGGSMLLYISQDVLETFNHIQDGPFRRCSWIRGSKKPPPLPHPSLKSVISIYSHADFLQPHSHLMPRIPRFTLCFSLIPFPNSPFWLLQIASSVCNLEELILGK